MSRAEESPAAGNVALALELDIVGGDSQSRHAGRQLCVFLTIPTPANVVRTQALHWAVARAARRPAS